MGEVKVRTTVVGTPKPAPQVRWPDGWPIPREGDPVEVAQPGDDPLTLYVRRVVWYPHGDALPDPFVYLVLGVNPRG